MARCISFTASVGYYRRVHTWSVEKTEQFEIEQSRLEFGARRCCYEKSRNRGQVARIYVFVRSGQYDTPSEGFASDYSTRHREST